MQVDRQVERFRLRQHRLVHRIVEEAPVGGAVEGADDLDRLVALEDGRDERAAGDEVAQRRVEVPLDVLGDLVSMGTLLAFVAVCAGVLILRRTRPELPRTFRVPVAPLTCTLGVLSCLVLLYWENWYNWMLMGLWTLFGFVIYFGYSFRHSKLRAKA